MTNSPEVDNLILVKIEPPIATITLNRPETHNALNRFMWIELKKQVEALPTNGSIRVGILEAVGKDFCAGADLPELAVLQEEIQEEGLTDDEIRVRTAMNYFGLVRGACEALETFPFPFIAKIRGSALGAGNDLIHACDLRIAAEGVRTGVPAGFVGIMLPPHEIKRFITSLGIANTSEMLFTGAKFNEKDSRRLLQVNRVVPLEDLDDEVTRLARQIARQSPEALMTAKAGIRLFKENPAFTDADIIPDIHYLWISNPANFYEGVTAFREKRKPNFQPE